MRKFLTVVLLIILVMCCVGCSNPASNSRQDRQNTLAIGDKLVRNQPTPTDIDYSLERYNLIRRTYWVNGMREMARTVACPIADIPLGYIVLLTESGSVVSKFVVEGKVSSLNSFLTPDSEYYEQMNSDTKNGLTSSNNSWLPDVDGSYGENDTGIFFFTPDGKYVEWTGTYLYSDIPFEISNSVIAYEVN